MHVLKVILALEPLQAPALMKTLQKENVSKPFVV